MIILLEKEDSSYFNKADKRLLMAFEAKDYKESLDIIEKIERRIIEDITLENDLSKEEAKECITIEKNDLTVEGEQEWLTTTINHGDDYWHIIRIEEEKYKKNSLDNFL